MNIPSISKKFCNRKSISVVIPVYNSWATALHAIDSVLSQTYQCSEIIVVDDGSTDNSADLIRRHFLAQSERVQVQSIENRGAAGARNFGISKAKCDWVAFLDSDDIWLPTKLEMQVIELQKDSIISLLGSLTNMQGFHINPLHPRERLSTISSRILLFKNYFQTSTVIVRRTILEELGGFPEGRRYAEEGDLFMRIAAKHKCVLLNEVLVDYSGGKRGFGASGLSANLWRMEMGELNNIWGAWTRGDNGIFISCVALTFSLIKFFRRVSIRFYLWLVRVTSDSAMLKSRGKLPDINATPKT
jgi:glycosyltransferase involved in cell wall biosynthesis